MQPRYIFVTVFSVAFLVVMFVLIGAEALPPGTGPPTILPADTPAFQVERVDVQVKAGPPIPTTTEPAAPQVTPPQGGLLLLEDHCAQCHAVQMLEQSQKSRTEWEITLARMEGIGVHLSDAEKVILLDYLAVADEP